MKVEYLVLISLLSIFFLSLFFRVTSYFVFSNLNVSVKELKEAKILLGYKPVMDIVEKQNITAEIINTGSLTIEEEMFIRIYYYNKSLVAIGEYWDSLRILKPGERNTFRIAFVPESTGTYFIQAKAKYDGRTTETWGRIDVLVYPIYHYVLQQPQKVEKQMPITVYLSPPKLEIIANDSFKTYKGGELFIPIIVKNLGERDAYEIRPYVSYPSDFQINLSPLYLSYLFPNQSISFFLKVRIPQEYPEGTYQMIFEVVGNETRAKKIINVIVEKLVLNLTQDYLEKILSLELILSEIKKKIFVLEISGYDVSNLKEKLDLIEFYLNMSKKFLDSQDFENCYKYITLSSNLVSETLMEMESIFLILPKAYVNYFLIVLVIMLIVGIILFVIYVKKIRERRPKLLREIESEGTE